MAFDCTILADWASRCARFVVFPGGDDVADFMEAGSALPEASIPAPAAAPIRTLHAFPVPVPLGPGRQLAGFGAQLAHVIGTDFVPRPLLDRTDLPFDTDDIDRQFDVPGMVFMPHWARVSIVLRDFDNCLIDLLTLWCMSQQSLR